MALAPPTRASTIPEGTWGREPRLARQLCRTRGGRSIRGIVVQASWSQFLHLRRERLAIKYARDLRLRTRIVVGLVWVALEAAVLAGAMIVRAYGI
jgi:hypothetical protein